MSSARSAAHPAAATTASLTSRSINRHSNSPTRRTECWEAECPAGRKQGSQSVVHSERHPAVRRSGGRGGFPRQRSCTAIQDSRQTRAAQCSAHRCQYRPRPGQQVQQRASRLAWSRVRRPAAPAAHSSRRPAASSRALDLAMAECSGRGNGARGRITCVHRMGGGHAQHRPAASCLSSRGRPLLPASETCNSC